MMKRPFLLALCAVALLAGCSKDKPKIKEAMVVEGTSAEEEVSSDPQFLFLEEYKQEPGIIVRPSGLLIRVIKEGTGGIPTASSFITANYHGTLIDGTVFDSTRDDGQPFSFPIDGVIDGWQEALTLMREGAIYEVVVPAELAYGNNGAGDSVPPGATLIFEIELLKVTNPLRPVAAQ